MITALKKSAKLQIFIGAILELLESSTNLLLPNRGQNKWKIKYGTKRSKFGNTDHELPLDKEERLNAAMDITNDDIDMNLINNVISGVANEVEFNSNNKSGMVRYMPQNGMEFETKEAAYAFYREYARSVGFGITIKSSRRSKKSGKFIDIKIACSKFGHKRHSATANTNPKACSKTDCKASMHIKKYNPEGKWFIYGFVEEHNHETCPDDFFSNAMRGKGKNDSSNRAQSVVSYFDRYVHKETTFDQFIHQLKLFLREISEDEAKAESETRHGQQELFSCSPFEMQMSKIYTRAIYKYFQAEVSGILSCTVAMEGEDEKTVTYRVDDMGRKQSFTVSWNKRKHDVCCLCHLLESRGFLCSHALSVLQLSGVFTVPPKYILERWTKDAKVGSITRQESISTNFRIQRLNDLCKLAVEVGEKGSLSGEAYRVAFGDLGETLKRCVDMRNSLKSNPGLLPIGQRKEKPKKKKIRAEAEKLSTGIHDGSQDVEQLNLNQRSHSLPDSYIYQQGLEGMEFGTRMPIINGYYNAEHDGHELLGHLNALPSLHGYYYTEQPFVQGVLASCVVSGKSKFSLDMSAIILPNKIRRDRSGKDGEHERKRTGCEFYSFKFLACTVVPVCIVAEFHGVNSIMWWKHSFKYLSHC
ncbi:FAR1-related sequence 2 [Striga asiatica]|uniref:Protein FAR1-RELATED SEQUENCE n=1 Tax=Striga asiatica TaxID=4170 RepID=A0A5A7R536_STRAF|nr:FAR1-related sequence 2 [Striga asiatica]